MQVKFHTLDVFTTRRFGGNPLAVVLDADALGDAQMLKIAREFNLSETIFVCRPKDKANSDCTANAALASAGIFRRRMPRP
jgi:trans-2,3-dihydro-3-hydroxyanthranilate isomerase